MKTYLKLDSQLRSETDQSIISNLIRKGWTEAPQPSFNPSSEYCEWVDGDWQVKTIPVQTYTAEQWLEKEGYSGNRPTVLLYQKIRLDATNQTSPKLSAVQSWLESMIAAATAPATSDWPSAPHSFEETLHETLAVLAN